MGRMVVVGKLLHPLFLEGDISKGWHVSSAVSAVASQLCVRLDVFLCLRVSLGCLVSHPVPQKQEGLVTVSSNMWEYLPVIERDAWCP